MPISVKFNPPVDETELLAAERRLGRSIPESYRSFLRVTDGGRPQEDRFSDMIGVNYFLGVAEIVETWEAMRGRLPGSVLPIAEDASGNLLCVEAAAQDRGSILFWDHELEPANRALTRVAASFEAFVEQLREAPPLPIETAAGAVSVQDPEALRQLKELERLEAAQPTVSWPPP